MRVIEGFLRVGILVLIGALVLFPIALQRYHKDSFLLRDDHIVDAPPTSSQELSDSPEETADSDQYLRTSLGGWGGSLRYRWQELPRYVSDFIVMGPSATGFISYTSQSSTFKYHWLHDQGVRLGGVFWPWSRGNSPLDTYYNESYRNNQLERLGNDIVNHSWSEYMDIVILGDEEPASGAFDWFAFGEDEWPPYIEKYNATYNFETGFWFKSIFEMNRTELYYFHEWINNRTAEAMNDVYDHVKEIRPCLEVSWSTMPWIGNEPGLWKTDVVQAGVYSPNPNHVYSAVRFYKTFNPKTPVWAGSYGLPYLDSFYFSPTDLEKLFWQSYFAGADMVSFFNHGWSDIAHGTLPDGILEEQYYDHIRPLYEEGRHLRPIDCSPQILIVSEERGFAATNGLGFTSWDVTTQRLVSIGSVNLSKYDLIIIKDQHWLWENFVIRLNDYVASGGNLILLGFTGSTLMNETGHPRQNLLEFEHFGTSYHAYDDGARLLVDLPNALNIRIESENGISRTAVNFSKTNDFTLINSSFPEETNEGRYSLFIYQNQSNPSAGRVFYCGLENGGESYIEELGSAFASLQKLEEGVPTDDTKGMIIGVGKNSLGEVVCGIVNGPEEKTISVAVSEAYWRGDVPVRLNVYRNKYLTTTSAIFLDTVTSTNGYFHVADRFFANSIGYLTLGLTDPTPRIRVATEPVLHTVVVDDAFPIRAQLFCELGDTQVNELNVTISLPVGLELVDPFTLQVTNLGNLMPDHPINYTWLVRAQSPGTYDILVQAKGSNCPVYNSTQRVGIASGRLSVKLSQSVISVLPDQKVVIDIYVSCYGQPPTDTVSIDHLVWNYVWGNPGSVLNLTEPLLSGETKHIEIEVSLANAVPGEIGWYHVVVFAGNDYLAMADLEIRIAEVLLDSTLIAPYSTFLVGDSVSMELIVGASGTAYAEDVISRLLGWDEVEVLDGLMWIWGDIYAGSSRSKILNLTFLIPGKHTLLVETVSANCPSTYSEIEVVVFAHPEIIIIPHAHNQTLEIIATVTPPLPDGMSLAWRTRTNSTFTTTYPYSSEKNCTFRFMIPWKDSIQFYLNFDRFSWPDVAESEILEFAGPIGNGQEAFTSLISAGVLLTVGVSVGFVLGILVYRYLGYRERMAKDNA